MIRRQNAKDWRTLSPVIDGRGQRRSCMHALCIAVTVAFVTAGSAIAAAAEHQRMLPKPTLVWAAAQLVPSPGLQIIQQHAYFSMRWQITPVLYSFGVRREVNPWRVLIAEPNLRQGGSIELFLSPEYTAFPGDLSGKWGLRSGVRSYVPLVEHGEGLSLSIGGSHAFFRGQHSIGFEAGAYVLFGILGLQVTYTPKLFGSEAWMASLRIRYF